MLTDITIKLQLQRTSDFVETIRKKSESSPFEDEQNEIDSKDLGKIYRHASIVCQEPKLEFFLPAVKRKNSMGYEILEEPKMSDFVEKIKGVKQWVKDGAYLYAEAQEKYNNAMKKVLFDGFKGVESLEPEYKGEYLVPIEESPIDVMIFDGKFKISIGGKDIDRIEDFYNTQKPLFFNERTSLYILTGKRKIVCNQK